MHGQTPSRTKWRGRAFANRSAALRSRGGASAQRFNAATRDRARSAYSSLTPRDVVIRHQWLFAAHWLQESVDEIEDDRLDYNSEKNGFETPGSMRSVRSGRR